MTELELVAIAICKSRTCEGINCCQWPAQGGRTQCPVKAGGYDEAARDAIQALDTFRAAEKRRNCKHHNRYGTGCTGIDGAGWSTCVEHARDRVNGQVKIFSTVPAPCFAADQSVIDPKNSRMRRRRAVCGNFRNCDTSGRL
jgi:hypothetical protein